MLKYMINGEGFAAADHSGISHEDIIFSHNDIWTM